MIIIGTHFKSAGPFDLELFPKTIGSIYKKNTLHNTRWPTYLPSFTACFCTTDRQTLNNAINAHCFGGVGEGAQGEGIKSIKTILGNFRTRNSMYKIEPWVCCHLQIFNASKSEVYLDLFFKI